MKSLGRFVSACCEGEHCYCGKPAEHKVEEVIFDDDPIQSRHPFTTYICHRHFVQIMGPAADDGAYPKLTEEEIEAARTPAGGFTKDQLAQWGVPWPPPKGWRDALMSGELIAPKEPPLTPSPIRPDVDAHDLLRQVVLAVVNAGHASDFYD